MIELCKHGIPTTRACATCYKARWAAAKRKTQPDRYAAEKARQRARYIPRPRANLADGERLGPWGVLIARIVGQAARDYCDPHSTVRVQRSAAAFLAHARVGPRRIRQAADVYNATLAAEDAQARTTTD